MACAKIGYSSERSARKRLRDIKRKRAFRAHHQAKVERRAYQCDHCRRWHLTSAPYED